MKIYHQIQVQNDYGLHVRPASKIAQLLEPFDSSVTFTYNSKSVDAKQVLSLLLLEAKKNAEIEIFIEGHDAENALSQLIAGFENRFEERS